MTRVFEIGPFRLEAGASVLRRGAALRAALGAFDEEEACRIALDDAHALTG